MVERLDEERIEMLRSWGEGLQSSDRDELRASGRAILMLIEDRLLTWRPETSPNE